MAEQELKACDDIDALVEAHNLIRGLDRPEDLMERVAGVIRDRTALTARLSSAEAEVERLRKRNVELVDHIYGCTGFVGDRAVDHPLTKEELAVAETRRMR